MPEEFEVKGPHDERLEHLDGENGERSDRFSSRIAVMAAVFATIGAVFSYLAGATQNEASMDKNNAAIKKTEAANQWNYYQAKSNKQNLAELAVGLPGVDADRYRAEVARYQTEKEVIKKDADRLEAQSLQWDKASEEVMHQHHRWAQATAAMQIAIALAAIALLTRKDWLLLGSLGVAGAGVAVGLMAWMHV
jgi:Na+/glutamate symporter